MLYSDTSQHINHHVYNNLNEKAIGEMCDAYISNGFLEMLEKAYTFDITVIEWTLKWISYNRRPA